MSLAWHRAIAYALVGEHLPLGDRPAPVPAVLVGELESLGWSSAAIGRRAREAAAHQRPWPFPVPDAVASGLGAAQLYAAVGQVRAALGLEVLEVLPPSTRTTLSADERRLLADRPPHYGRA